MAFLGGKIRVLSATAKLGFHQPAFPVFTESHFRPEVEKHRALYLAAGVRQDFIDRALSTPNATLWTPSHPDLLAAGMITRIADGTEFAYSEAGRWKGIAQVEEDLLRIPLYQVLKAYEPVTYSEILQDFDRAVRGGATQGELIEGGRRRVVAVLQRRLPHASDGALSDFVGVVVDQLTQLDGKPGPVCFNVLFPGRVPGVQPDQFLTKAAKERELQVSARVIETAAREAHPIPTEQQVEKILLKVYTAVVERHGQDAGLLEQLESPTIDKVKACRVMRTMYAAILTLPLRERANLLRVMLAAR